jgi:hypothetical protein
VAFVVDVDEVTREIKNPWQETAGVDYLVEVVATATVVATNHPTFAMIVTIVVVIHPLSMILDLPNPLQTVVNPNAAAAAVVVVAFVRAVMHVVGDGVDVGVVVVAVDTANVVTNHHQHLVFGSCSWPAIVLGVTLWWWCFLDDSSGW